MGKSWILTLLPLFRGSINFSGYKGIIFRVPWSTYKWIRIIPNDRG